MYRILPAAALTVPVMHVPRWRKFEMCALVLGVEQVDAHVACRGAGRQQARVPGCDVHGFGVGQVRT